MAERRDKAAQYGEWLRAVLDSQGIGVRTLARRLNPANPEAIRANLYRYLRGTTHPLPATQARIAAALGLAPEAPR